MYGGANGEASTSKTQAQTNTTKSNAKTIVDSWYLVNIKNPGYAKYIADNIFCNDRSIASGFGYGNQSATYNVDQRTKKLSVLTPTLKCVQKNDRFTVTDTSKGNGALSYPVGLITADEVLLGGIGYKIYNTNHYLYTGQHYWTMSLSGASYGNMSVSNFNPGAGLAGTVVASVACGLRPVINLISGIEISGGKGTTNDPYIIAET